jgi:hypothetical protein
MSRILFDFFDASATGLVVDAMPASFQLAPVTASVAVGAKPPSIFAMSAPTVSVLIGTLPTGTLGLGNGQARRIH